MINNHKQSTYSAKLSTTQCLGPLYPIKSPCQLAPPHKLRGSHLPQHGQQPLGDSRGPPKSFQKRCLHQSLGELSYQKGLFLGDLTTINTPCPIKAKVLNSHLTNLSFSLQTLSLPQSSTDLSVGVVLRVLQDSGEQIISSARIRDLLSTDH